MKLKFTKMQGAGNDFVVLDGIRQRIDLTPAQYRMLADRHFGVGCDQILLVETTTRPDCDFRYRIFNADGGEVQQCGNGARCFVRFVHEQGLTPKREIRVETAAGVIVPRLEEDGQVTVDMGPPRFVPAEIPFIAAAQALTYVIDVDGEPVELSALSMGNPHAVRVVCDVDSAPVQELGAKIEHHPSFPERVNVGFMQVLHRREIKLRVFERGAGETLACGTGACAAVVAGITRGLLDDTVQVHTRGGDLSIRWAGLAVPPARKEHPSRPPREPSRSWGGPANDLSGHNVFLTGPAVTVFQGEIEP